MEMEISEKTKVILAAVHAAAAKGFDFLEWYQRTLNILPTAKMPEETRIQHMCSLGIEKLLIIDIEFVMCLKKQWQRFLLKMVLDKEPLYVLRDHLVHVGALNE